MFLAGLTATEKKNSCPSPHHTYVAAQELQGLTYLDDISPTSYLTYKCLESFRGTSLSPHQPPPKAIWNVLPFMPFFLL